MSGLALAVGSVLPVVATAALTGLVWRQREHPAARLLLGASVAMVLGSLLHLVVRLAPGLVAGVTNAKPDGSDWPLLVFPVTAVAGGLWLLFALQYTGRGQSIFRIAAANVIGLTGAAVVTVGLYLGGLLTEPLATDLVSLIVLVVSTLAAVGVFVLVGVSVGQNAFPSREPLFFAGGAVALVAGVSVAASFQSTLAYTSMLTGAGVLFSRAVVRTSAFETLPAAQVVGRDQVIEEMTDAVVVVDRDGRIRDLNAAAEELFETTRAALAGAPFAELLVASCPTLEEITGDDLTRVETADGRSLVVRADQVVGERAGELGYLLVWTDITDQQRREQRLTILNRVLVKTLGKRVREIRDDAAQITADATDRQATADRVWTTASSLIRLVADARSLERTLASDQPQADQCEDLAAEVREVVESESLTGRQALSVTVDAPPEPVAAAVSVSLVHALTRTLLADAMRQATERVTVEILPTAAVAVTDDRPNPAAAAEQERGDLSVAIARLVADSVGGTVAVDTANQRRQTTVRLPTPAGPEQTEAQLAADRDRQDGSRTETETETETKSKTEPEPEPGVKPDPDSDSDPDPTLSDTSQSRR